MKVTSCKLSGMEVSPTTYNACTFQVIDKWDSDQHAKTCDTMFYLSDGTGAYVWDCDKWTFLDFTGVSQSDWTAKENEEGYIKNKPFKTLGNGLAVDENGVLNVTVKAGVTSVNGKTGDVKLIGSDIAVYSNSTQTVSKAISDLQYAERLETDGVDLNDKLTTRMYFIQKEHAPLNGPQEYDGKDYFLKVTQDNQGSLSLQEAYYFETSATSSEKISPMYRSYNAPDWSHWVAFDSQSGGTTTEAEKLSTARDLKVDLTSKLAQSFDGSADADEIGVTGTLPIANGGTGNSKGEAIPKTTNPNVSLTDGTVNSAATNPVLKYRILNDVIYISGSIDVVADGQTSGMQVKVGSIPTQYMPKKAVQGVGYIPIKCDYLGEGREKGSVIVVGDSQSSASAQGAVMFYASTEGTEKLTSATWTFFGSYNLI